ncbi:MAG: type 1 glutamine amidotransferase [Thermodesulfobacteriota bacterium]
MKLLVLQHSPWEGPGILLKKTAQKLRTELVIARVWAEPLPDFRRFAGLLILGGGANVDQEAQYPFLIEEKRLLRAAVAADMPCLGFCLGHQLLAQVLGATIGPNFCSSIGFTQGHLTHDGREHPLFSGIGQTVPLFKWHAQTALEPLPKHLVVLMTSAECQVEALSVIDRPHLIGLQFDNHAAAPEDVALWLQKDQKWLSSLQTQDISPRAILDAAQVHAQRTAADLATLFANFLRLLR